MGRINPNGAFGAFIEPDLVAAGSETGALAGLAFAVKDVFAVAGHRSSAGNPDWLRTHQPSLTHAAAIRKLLQSGASLRGAAHTDELMYSLGGENYHYGTPVNPRAEGRIPGGSSSGSAVAVASGSVDFALGTDTGGSVRVPSSYCGVYGFRPTHGAVEMEGVIPLAPGFDTVGWIADSPELLLRAGEVLLGGAAPGSRDGTMGTLHIVPEAWALAGAESTAGLKRGLRRLEAGAGRSGAAEIAPEGLKTWMDVFRELQGAEIWATHGAWIERVQPLFGPDIAARFAWAAGLAGQDHSRAQAMRAEIAARLRQLLGEDGCLVLPTVPGPAPLRGGDLAQLELNRSGAMMLSCIAGLAGLPQVTLPISGPGGLPLGLSVIGGHGQDLRLLSWVRGVWQ
ncbi:amidase [Paenibacillus sp. S150]|uniref:amidase n=1 Tax=Paenibacillus sp. S150 TaxID=2749826 RepID=UPI001C5977B3|nr:amidase [Paenibacillus sp. S150]MBW4085786.1 amidase [Paenibacillus sp. S150]